MRSPVDQRFVDHKVPFAQFFDEFGSGQHGFYAVHPLFYRFTLGHHLRTDGERDADILAIGADSR